MDGREGDGKKEGGELMHGRVDEWRGREGGDKVGGRETIRLFPHVKIDYTIFSIKLL